MIPKHQKTAKFIAQGLFKNIVNFKELEQRITNLSLTERGDAFEVFAEAYFATQKLSQAAEIWPDKAIPVSLRDSLGLTSRDMGVDGIIRTREDHYHAYQIKFRSGRANLTWEELSTFMGLSDRVQERILFTNSTDLPALMQDRTDFYAIKGTDLDALDKTDFQRIEEWLKSGNIVFKRKDPLPHQDEALTNIISALKISDRTTAVMACGTGKTLISLWVAERLCIDTILILLPSLSLVRQMLHVWMKETVWDDCSFLCVCSDQSVVKGFDEIVLHQSDLDFPVTTDSESVKKFLSGKSKHKLVFSTYHSSKVVAEGLPNEFAFDLGIFDEAHKTAGREGTSFSFALKNENFPIKKRLFLTATPRHYDVSKRSKEGDPQLVFSMDDQEIYGSISHKLSFTSAASMGIICKYKIIISVITEEMVSRELLKKGEVIVKGDIVKANQIARALAIKNAIEEYGVKRIFTFHSSVKAAKSFTSASGEGISVHLDDFITLHVNGEMPTSRRDSIMREFAGAPKALMSNARCLTEGIDVPAVDMVAFMSPKKSRVDITQAIGRAMRKAPDKEYGYIFLPIFLEVAKGENIETALEKTQFQDIWDVLEAMQEQDEGLAEIIRKMREDIGRKKGFDDSLLRERLELIGSGLGLDQLRKAITIKLVTTLGAMWDERYGELFDFKEKNHHCNVPQDYPENQKLSTWVGEQRTTYKKKKISQERIKKLELLGFDWDPKNTAWDKMFLSLCEFKRAHGHCNVPVSYIQNPMLLGWVRHQRDKFEIYKRSDELQYRIKKLDELGFDWDPFHNAWEQMYSALCEFKERNGHSNVSTATHQQLGSWVLAQRTKFNKGTLSEERITKLQEIEFIWNAIEAKWNEMFAALHVFKGAHGHCNVPQGYSENPPLANWVGVQRTTHKEKKISQERINKLEALGFDWDPINSAWDEMFQQLCSFKKTNNHCNVPKDFENQQLSTWVSVQRTNYKSKKILQERIDQLEKIGFDWDPITSAWEEMYSALREFKKLNRHCNVPQIYHLNPQLGSWIATQRSKFNKGQLSQERRQRLESIGVIWDPHTAAWEDQFIALEEFKAAHNHCNVPKEYSLNPTLGAWVSKQRKLFNQKNLSSERVEKLENIGLPWNPRLSRWDMNYNELVLFKNKHGHFNILKVYPEKTNLDHWMRTQRTVYKKDKLSKERIQKLEAIDFVWDPTDTEWEALYSALCNFQMHSGHCKVPARYPLNKKLATWVSLLRVAFHEGKLPQDKIIRLETIGFDWDPFETAWQENFLKLCKFNELNEHMNISSTNPETKPLANWASKQREQYEDGLLAEEKISKLVAIGFIWDPVTAAWDANFQLLCEFEKVNGHCNVPQKAKDKISLASWVNRQRTEYNKGTLSTDRIEKLENIGFDWYPNDSAWQKMFENLCLKKAELGHLNLQNTRKDKLAKWMIVQRFLQKQGKLPVERHNLLSSIGFEF